MTTESPTVAYVSVSGENRIAILDVDAASGALRLRGPGGRGSGGSGGSRGLALPGQPGPLALSRDGRCLYAAVRSVGSAAMMAIGPDGGLSLEQVKLIGGSAPYITVDHTGRWLLGACYTEGIALAQSLDPAGRFTDASPRIVSTAKNAHCIVVSADNRFAYVPHTGPNAIHQFAFDSDSGNLTPLDPPLATPGTGTPGIPAPDSPGTPTFRGGPRHLLLHPTLDLAYVVNETIASVTTYQVDRRHGTLSPMQTLSALPADFTGRNSGADIHLTPDGRWLYSSNRGHDSLAVFRVDEHTGRLEPAGHIPTEPTPRAFTIDPTGRFVYVAGQDSGRIATYRIDQTTGRLDPLGHVEVGAAPLWITLHSPHGGS